LYNFLNEIIVEESKMLVIALTAIFF